MTAEPSGTPPSRLPGALNLGCGRQTLVGALSVDISSTIEPDLVLDVTPSPRPRPSDWFDVVHADYAGDHLENVVAFFARAGVTH